VIPVIKKACCPHEEPASQAELASQADPPPSDSALENPAEVLPAECFFLGEELKDGLCGGELGDLNTLKAMLITCCEESSEEVGCPVTALPSQSRLCHNVSQDWNLTEVKTVIKEKCCEELAPPTPQPTDSAPEENSAEVAGAGLDCEFWGEEMEGKLCKGGLTQLGNGTFKTKLMKCCEEGGRCAVGLLHTSQKQLCEDWNLTEVKTVIKDTCCREDNSSSVEELAPSDSALEENSAEVQTAGAECEFLGEELEEELCTGELCKLEGKLCSTFITKLKTCCKQDGCPLRSLPSQNQFCGIQDWNLTEVKTVMKGLCCPS